ncbi:MAG: flagellar biosynthesis protein FlhA [Deltaproteobacteria bacterium]|nr:flagellar biosynthesis protein FlhA [Deltaproteobacteria bacterium]
MDIQNSMPLPSVMKNSDVVVTVGVVLILVFMILPLPTFLLDVLLTLDITLAIIVIFVAMYTRNPLEFSVFPSLLLIATLFRLSLNIASTRLILLHGNEGTTAAGHVIKAFGAFVVGGNPVVGLIVFAILVVINFVVITKGAGRIAEVAARFNLDAMPGKQMSIDADLNAGLITESEARNRRAKIEKEADFYGAMDGASKFVRGDAVAGIIITLINIMGGLIIGVLQQKMTVSRAVQVYTLLTVGDGLVSQIPALIISTAAGIVVTRAAQDVHLGNAMVGQILVQPRAIVIASVILFLFGLVPGLPQLPFFLVSLLTGGIALTLIRGRRGAEAEDERAGAGGAGPEEVEPLQVLPLPDPLGLEVGYGLIPLVDSEQDGELLGRIRSMRKQFALDMGMIFPPVHIRDNLQLPATGYSILIKGNEVAKGEFMQGHLLAMKPARGPEKPVGIPTREPVFGLPAEWILEGEREKAQIEGYTVVDHCTILATHLSEIIKSHAHELLGRQEVQSLMDNLAKDYPKVVEELVPHLLSLGEVQKVLQGLLREQVSIRDLLTILETLADYAPMTKNVTHLTEYVRQALARTIVRPYQGDDGRISLITLDPRIENAISEAIQHTEKESYLSLEPQIAQKILSRTRQAMEEFLAANLQPIVLCAPVIRPHFKKLTERFLPRLVVLSHNEIPESVTIQSKGMVGWSDAD